MVAASRHERRASLDRAPKSLRAPRCCVRPLARLEAPGARANLDAEKSTGSHALAARGDASEPGGQRVQGATHAAAGGARRSGRQARQRESVAVAMDRGGPGPQGASSFPRRAADTSHPGAPLLRIAASQQGRTALMVAANTGSVAATQALLALGADADAKDTVRFQSCHWWRAAEALAGDAGRSLPMPAPEPAGAARACGSGRAGNRGGTGPGRTMAQ